jgi:hypothetical protein
MDLESPPPGLAFYPTDVIGNSAEWLRDRLSQLGTPFYGDSELGVSLSALEAFRVKTENKELVGFPTTDLAYQYLSTIYGADFLSKSLRFGEKHGFMLPPDMLRKIKRSNPLVTQPGENDKPRNLVWEMVIASLASGFCSDVRLAEPDVTCVFKGKKFAVAAKIVYSRERLIDRIEEGLKQIKGRAESALVFVNIVQIYPMIETLRSSRKGRWGGNDQAVEVLKNDVFTWCEKAGLKDIAVKIREQFDSRCRILCASRHPLGTAAVSILLYAYASSVGRGEC